MKTITQISASLLALAWSGAAGSPSAFAADAQPVATPGTLDSGGSNSAGEIVVTATRQAQAITKVPQSITAMNQKTLDAKHIETISDLTRLTPSIEFLPNGFGDQADISIRGISDSATSGVAAGAATTAIYIDDVPIQTRSIGYSSTNAYPEIFDLDRVEVERGPQGTLFGASAEGGAIRFITPEPSLTRFSVYARGELSGTEHANPFNYEGGLAIGAPLIDGVLGLRLSVWHRFEGGYINRQDQYASPLVGTGLGSPMPVVPNENWDNVTNARAALLWEPDTRWKIEPSLFWQQRKQGDVGTFWEGISNPSAGVYINGQPLAQPVDDHFVLPALKIEYRGAAVTVISNTSYFDRRDNGTFDYSTLTPAIFTNSGTSSATYNGVNFLAGYPGYAAYAQMINTQRNWTEELRAQPSNTSGRLNWTAGIFLSAAKQVGIENVADPNMADVFGGLDPAIVLGVPLIDNTYSLVAKTVGIDRQAAVFGEVGYKLTDTLKLTVGARVSRDSFTGYGNAAGPFTAAPPSVTNPTTEKDTPFTPKASLAWQADPHDLFYTTVAKGYRIGGTNAPLSATCNLAGQGFSSTPASYGPDNVWSYEIGAKNKLFGNRLEIDSSAFTIQWNNIQQLVYVSNCGQQFVDNLGAARSRGFDLQYTLHPFPGLDIDGSVAYTDTTFTQTVNKNPGVAANVVTAGDHLETVPWTITLGGTYTVPVARDRNLYLHADWAHHSGSKTNVWLDPNNGSYNPLAEPYPTTDYVNLRLGLRAGKFDASLFVDNLTDAQPALARYQEVLGNPVFRDMTFRPLTAGMTVIFRD